MKHFFCTKKAIRKPLRKTVTETVVTSKKDVTSYESILRAIKESGIYEFFSSAVGGSKDKKAIDSVVLNLTRFLIYSHQEKKENHLAVKDIFSWFEEVIKTEYALIGTYITHLETYKERKASTIQMFLNNLSIAGVWYVYHCTKKHSHFEPSSAGAFEHVIKNLRRTTKIKKRKERREKTIEAAIWERRIPHGGLPTLQNIVRKEMEVVKNLKVFADAETYINFMQLMFASLYVFSVQGRVSGIADLKYGQRIQLQEQSYAMTDKFKTFSTFGYQAVTLAEESRQLFDIYINKIRPYAPTSCEDTDPLWVSWRGKPYSEAMIGKAVTIFFARKANLRCSSTMIRTLVETAMESLQNQGIISTEERKSITSLNGHSSAIVQNHYLLTARVHDVQNATNAFEKLKDAPLPVFDIPARTIDWGKLHPEYARTNPTDRIKWSQAEIDYIGHALNQLPVNGRTDQCSQILKIIERDPHAHDIFHINHVSGTPKIRNGYEAYLRSTFGYSRKRKIEEIDYIDNGNVNY